MSARSNIPVSEDLKRKFAEAVSENCTRAFKISILQEALHVAGEIKINDTLREDLAHVASLLEEKVPCYLLISTWESAEKDEPSFFQETRTSGWVLVTYIPDDAPVKEKMLYSSTKYSILKGLGESMITTQVDISERSELEYKEYLRYINEKKAPATLTAQEKAEQKMRMDQAVSEEMMRGTERKNIVPGLALELTEDAKEELHNLHIGKQALVILKVNREKGKGEVIDMDKGYDFASLSRLISLESLFPNSEPRFGFFLCKKDQSELRTPNTAHLMEMDHLESIFDEPVFIYSCPPDCTIQDKMLYASSKAALLEKVHCEFGLVEKKRIEVSDPAELTIEFIKGELSRLKMTSTVNSNASSSYFAGSNSLGDQQMFISGTESQLQRPSLGKNLRKFNKPLAPSRKKSMS